MPLFEFECGKCQAQFETLVRADTKVVCPKCGSPKVEKLLSTFAAHSGGRNETPPCHSSRPGCDLGKCGSGRCGLE